MEKNEQERTALETLYNHMKENEMIEAHAKIENVFQDEGYVGIISIYKDLKPAHEILDELKEWAAENHNLEVLNKIAWLTKRYE